MKMINEVCEQSEALKSKLDKAKENMKYIIANCHKGLQDRPNQIVRYTESLATETLKDIEG